MTERKSLGRRLAGASIPAPPGREELPTDYRVLLGEIKERIRAERVRVVLAANQAMVLLYWDIGKAILARQEREGWGAGTIDRLSHDLRVAFPDMRGLSPRNLKYMRAFAAAWPEREVVQEVLAQITWYHNIALLEKVDDRTVRLWYAAKAREAGWSRNVLAVRSRTGGTSVRATPSPTSPGRCHPPTPNWPSSRSRTRTCSISSALQSRARSGSSNRDSWTISNASCWRWEPDSPSSAGKCSLRSATAIFASTCCSTTSRLRRFVVVELKAVPFSPAFVGQMNLYLSAVDDLMRHPDDAPTIGLLLCKGKDRLVVEYALRDLAKPLGVADWETRLVEVLPDDLKGSLPTIEEIEAELGGG